MSNFIKTLIILKEDLSPIDRAKEAFSKYKELIASKYPEITKSYQFKHMKLIFNNTHGKKIAALAYRSSNTISIGLDYLEAHTDEMVTQILGHEFAHLVAPLLHGDKGEGHTPSWKKVMKDLGLRVETYHNMEDIK